MQPLVYGTKNPAKLAHMREMLAPTGIDFIGLSEIQQESGVVVPEVAETGNLPLENAKIKATAYFNALKRPVFACDTGLFIDELHDNEQPGVNVRTIDGKRLNDSEMTAYYAAVARRFGGRVTARYKNAICLIMAEGEVFEHSGDELSGNAFYIVSEPHSKQRVEGFPIDPLSKHIKSGAYYYDLDDKAVSDDDTYGMSEGFRAFFKRALQQPH